MLNCSCNNIPPFFMCRNWKVTNDMLLDQISFLSFEKSSRDTSYDHMNTYTGILDGRLTENLKEEDYKDDGTFFDSDDEPSIKETKKIQTLKESDVDPLNEEEEQLTKDEPDADLVVEEAQVEEPVLANTSSSSTIQPEGSPEREEEEIIERPNHLEISQTESIASGDSLVTSTPKTSNVEFKSQEVQTPTQSRVKRRRRSSLLNLKRTRKAIIIPIPQGQKMPNPEDINELGEDSPVKVAIKILFKHWGTFVVKNICILFCRVIALVTQFNSTKFTASIERGDRVDRKSSSLPQSKKLT